ncbi:MAG: T9SS type A sorting domain-containing protein, partial [Candidatus Zixiibacteriota bacterium]
ELDNSLPESFTLGQNYPNPFNPSTTISFNLPEKTSVNLSIYNILGQAVAILKNETLPSGQHKVEWNSNNMNGQPVTSGVYFYRLETDSFSDVKKMLLLR